MESTSCGQQCPFFKQGFCSSERECPNYVETWWVESEKETPRMIKDCSPKRMLLQQQVLQSKLDCVQQALEQSRNEYHCLSNNLKSLIQMSQTIINHNQIEVKNENAIYIPLINDEPC